MTDQNPGVTPPVATTQPVSIILLLAERFPACFNWENPQPLKIGIHKDLAAAGFLEAGVNSVNLKRALGRYCNRPRYRRTLREGKIRVDLQGQPAGAVTATEADLARATIAIWKARKEGQPAPPYPGAAILPPNDTPLSEENLVPGRLELTVKFSELPQPLQVQGGIKIGIETPEGVVITILSPKVWRKLEQAAKDYSQWVAALNGLLDRVADGQVILKQPALQVFEKKNKATTAVDTKTPDATD